jgi:hypothetical protein
MPPFLMLIAAAFVVIMVMMGKNPVDKWRADAEKYGRDPLAREINKFNEEQAQKGAKINRYKPPPGATTYRLPPEESQLIARDPFRMPGVEPEPVRPAPDIPMEEWGSRYPSYMIQRGTDNNLAPQQNEVVLPPRGGGTSLVPGSGFGGR